MLCMLLTSFMSLCMYGVVADAKFDDGAADKCVVDGVFCFVAVYVWCDMFVLIDDLCLFVFVLVRPVLP